jgi:phosphatidylserine/phosphatidylglycerophosphate/cardiolipin synthase-like enzyme
MPLHRTVSRLLLGLAFLSPAPTPAHAQRALPALEFVESVPRETSLDDPGIPNTLQVWLELIHGARHTLDIEQFYISPKPGEALDTVLAAIRHAAARGIHVRIIVDSRMHRTYPSAPAELGAVKNIAVRVIDFRTAGGGIQHAKFFVVDGATTFIGSQNFDWRALTHIRELGLIIRDEATTALYRRVFEADWRLAGGEGRAPVAAALAETTPVAFRPLPLAPRDTAMVLPTFSPAGLIPDSSLWDLDRLLELIDGAERELFLQFLSYSTGARDGGTWTLLDDALRHAAGRGVDVRLVVADWGKAARAEESLKALAAVPGVRVRYSVIPEWSGGYISYARVEHCKYVVADAARFWLGTSNAEKSYFLTSRNLGIVVRSPSLGHRLRNYFLAGWNGPYGEPLLPDATYRPRKHDGE